MSQAPFISWTSENGRTTDLAMALGLEPIFVHLPGRFGLLGRYLRQFRATRRILAEHKPQAAALMLPPIPALWAIATSRHRPARLICDLHTGFFLDPKWRWAAVPGLRLMRSIRATALVTNEALRERCVAEGVSAVVLHDVLRPPRASSESRGYLLCPLSYANDEPIAALIEAARVTPHVAWVFTGRAPASVRRGAPANVTFTGFVEDEEFAGLVAHAAAVVALTTRPHTMQRAGYEAFNVGVPQLTSDFPELRAFYGDTAVYANADDASIAAGAEAVLALGSELAGRIPAHRQRHIFQQQAALAEVRNLIHTPEKR